MRQASNYNLIESMKDFQEMINKGHFQNGHPHHNLPNPQINTQNTILDYATQFLPYLSPFLLSIVTGPFTTASVLLQVANKGIANGLQAKLKSAPLLQRHIKNGLFGDNRIYEAMTVQSYKDAFSKLGKEGIRGLYKGNLTGIVLATSNAWLRQRLYNGAGEKGFLNSPLYSSAFIYIYHNQFVAVATCTIADLITLPLMTAQSRLIFQNSSLHFRTYSSFLSVWRKAKFSLLFSGGSVLLFKNIMFNLAWVKVIPESPAYSFIISSIACHFVTYPFITVIRQMQISEPNVPMMKNRCETIRQGMGRIWNQGGIRQFYRGFLAYGVIHLFMGALMVQANLRSGYFYQS